jgi:two-component system, NtrC family, response regulator PilR
VVQKRILLVDDDDDVRELLALALRSEGYFVDVAASAARALSNLMESEYALVIADWRLPDGDGMAVANFAEQRGAKTVIMSGYLFHMPSSKAEQCLTLMKPLQPSEVAAVVRSCIGDPLPSA